MTEAKPTPTPKAATTNNAEFQAAVAVAAAPAEQKAEAPAPSQQTRTRRVGMTEPQEEKPAEKLKSRTYERLKCTPIMVYPDSQDERDEIKAAADADNRSVSNYILTLVLKHLRGGNDAW